MSSQINLAASFSMDPAANSDAGEGENGPPVEGTAPQKPATEGSPTRVEASPDMQVVAITHGETVASQPRSLEMHPPTNRHHQLD